VRGVDPNRARPDQTRPDGASLDSPKPERGIPGFPQARRASLDSPKPKSQVFFAFNSSCVWTVSSWTERSEAAHPLFFFFFFWALPCPLAPESNAILNTPSRLQQTAANSSADRRLERMCLPAYLLTPRCLWSQPPRLVSWLLILALLCPVSTQLLNPG